jgi:hypothetical protein
LRAYQAYLNIGLLLVSLTMSSSWCKAQYMPLDVSEMYSRINVSTYDFTIHDSVSQKIKIDLSLVSENHGSFFISSTYSKMLNKNISYYYKLFFTNNPNYGPRIGSRYERSGNYVGPRKPGDVSTLRSYLYFDFEDITIRAGKFSPWGNPVYRFDIEHNHLLPPVYGFEYKYNLTHFQYTHGNYWLGYSSSGDNVVGYSRFYASQKLKYFGNYFNIELGDRVIYSGVNQPLNWSYLVPLDPFIISVFNFGAPSNNDNHAIDISFIVKPNDRFRIIGKAIIDEFGVDAADRVYSDDDYGIQISSILDTDNDYMKQIAINYIYNSDYLGIHHSKSTNFEIQGLPIFSVFGPQTRRIEVVNNFFLVNEKIKGWIAFYWQSQGKNRILGTPWNARATTSDHESWEIERGIDAEIFFQINERYNSFMYINISDTSSPLFEISLAYSI